MLEPVQKFVDVMNMFLGLLVEVLDHNPLRDEIVPELFSMFFTDINSLPELNIGKNLLLSMNITKLKY